MTETSAQAYPYLSEKAIAILSYSDEDRITYIRSPRWIGYPKAKEILDTLEELLNFPTLNRMPNLLIVGDTNNGKSMLVERFSRKHPANDNPEGSASLVPVLLIQAPPVPDEGRFYNIILERLFAPYRPADRVDKKQVQVMKVLKQIGLKMLIIDEIHHMLAGHMLRQKAFLNVIKYMGNELRIPIVGVGTRDAYRAIQTDAQLANRFDPMALPRWKLDEDFQRLLVSFERMLPLKKPSGLNEDDLAGRLYAMCEGYLGELSRLLCAAAVVAVQTGREHIDRKLLDGMGWVAPSERRRVAG